MTCHSKIAGCLHEQRKLVNGTCHGKLVRQSTDSSTIPRCIDLMCHLTDKGTCQESVLTTKLVKGEFVKEKLLM